jgi:hypothetical protein
MDAVARRGVCRRSYYANVSEAESDLPFSSLVTSPTDYAGAIEPEYLQQRIARRKFLQAVEKQVPGFLSAVRDEIFPAYAKAFDGETTHATLYGPIPMGWLEIDQRSKLRKTGRKFAAVRKKILACAARFNLTVRHPESITLVPAAWACDVIAVTLWHWQQDAAMVLHFPFRSDEFTYGDWVTTLEARRYTVSLPARGPNPNESLLECKGRLSPLFEKQLRRDWEAAQGRGPGPNKNADHHFEWFARFQVGGLLPREIASKIRVPNPGKKSAQVSVVRTDEAHAIQRSLKSTADVLGLCPRPLPIGRPKRRR